MGALRLLITGANGFLGRACVDTALARGHSVRAMTRNAASFPDGVEAVLGDLAEGCDAAFFEGVDAVIHTAASVSNDARALERDTVLATRLLIEAAEAAHAPPMMVLASSIAVYDAGLTGTVDEASQIETLPAKREPYIASKLAQEAMLCEASLRGWCMRIGALYDTERRWNAHIGVRKGPVLLSLGRKGDVPVVNVKDAAEAMIRAAETAPEQACEALDIVESDLPSRATFIAAEHSGLHFPLHWRLLLPAAWLCEAVLGPRAPGLLRPRILRARMQAVSYPNERAKTRLGWLPQKQFVKVKS
jgi:nucleoside-diphosphate-sugar epimerase